MFFSGGAKKIYKEVNVTRLIFDPVAAAAVVPPLAPEQKRAQALQQAATVWGAVAVVPVQMKVV